MREKTMEGNNGATNPTEIHLMKLNQRYLNRQREMKEPPDITVSIVVKQYILLL